MYRLAVALVILLTGAAVAAAALIQGQAGRSERITGTSQVDRILAGRGDDVVFARDQRADYVNCGPGQDVAVLDHVDRTRGCETKRYPPKPTAVAPSPVGLVKAGPRGSVTPLPKKNCLHRRRGCPPPPPPPEPEPEPEPQPGPPGPSGAAMPVGDLPGWHQIFSDDFTTPLASWGDCTSFAAGRDCPGLPAAYRAKWWAYPSSYQDTREKISGDGGFYQPANMSMEGGLLHMRLRRAGGTSQSAAPIPKIAGASQTYGRYTIRWRADSSSVFKAAWLLWRTTSPWGEIDFPEGDLDSGICAFNHGVDGGNALAFCSSSTPFAGVWHTSVVEWTPGQIRFFLDGALFASTTNQVPASPMTWVIQTETVLSGSLPSATPADVNVYIDWVAIWSRV